MSPLLIVLPMFFVMGITESTQMDGLDSMTGVFIKKSSSNSKGDCTLEGKTYKNGTIISLPGKFKCLDYRCLNGNIQTVREECQFRGSCYPLGTLLAKKCSTHICKIVDVKDSRFIGFAVIKAGCIDYKRKCHKVHEKFDMKFGHKIHHGCTCIVKNFYLHYECPN